MAATETERLAVLNDADNASASVVKELLEEVAKYGIAMVKRAYGDWTTQVQRQRLHSPGYPHARSRQGGLWPWRTQDAGALHRRLR